MKIFSSQSSVLHSQFERQLVQTLKETRVIPGAVSTYAEARVCLLASSIRAPLGCRHPAARRWEDVVAELTAGREHVPQVDSSKDPFGLESCMKIVEAAESEEKSVNEWRVKIDHTVAVMEHIPLEAFLTGFFVSLPFQVVRSSLEEELRIKLLEHLGSQLENLLETRKRIPLLTSLVVAAADLEESDLVQKAYQALEIAIRGAGHPEEALHIFSETIGLMDVQEETVQLMGNASRLASKLGQQETALDFARRRFGFALILIQRGHVEEEEEETEEKGRRNTLPLDFCADVRQISPVLEEASVHLDRGALKQLFDYASEAAHQLGNDQRDKVLFLLAQFAQRFLAMAQ